MTISVRSAKVRELLHWGYNKSSTISSTKYSTEVCPEIGKIRYVMLSDLNLKLIFFLELRAFIGSMFKVE